MKGGEIRLRLVFQTQMMIGALIVMIKKQELIKLMMIGVQQNLI